MKTMEDVAYESRMKDMAYDLERAVYNVASVVLQYEDVLRFALSRLQQDRCMDDASMRTGADEAFTAITQSLRVWQDKAEVFHKEVRHG